MKNNKPFFSESDLDEALHKLEIFIKDKEKLNTAFQAFSSIYYIQCDFGDDFIQDYVDLLVKMMDDSDSWISWFVFKNKFGKKKLKAKVGREKSKIIKNVKDLYKYCLTRK